jgi:hypothetical protein
MLTFESKRTFTTRAHVLVERANEGADDSGFPLECSRRSPPLQNRLFVSSSMEARTAFKSSTPLVDRLRAEIHPEMNTFSLLPSRSRKYPA